MNSAFGTATTIRGDALHLPIADETVNLIVTSPPYFGLRSYTDGGVHYAGQLGSEATPTEFVAALIAATREMVRVLKPSGSIFINLGDKYAGSRMDGSSGNGTGGLANGQGHIDYWDTMSQGRTASSGGIRTKSLIGIPWRYALACIDDLGLILRAEIIWSKPSGLPESVTDRVRRSHEQLFHFVKEPRYYSAVDEIREAQTSSGGNVSQKWQQAGASGLLSAADGRARFESRYDNPLGKLPGSVWSIASQPLVVPASLGVDHFAAFPMELPRRIIRGWSPPGVCTVCGEGRRPVTDKDRQPSQRVHNGHGFMSPDHGGRDSLPHRTLVAITGYACACTPYTDHPGTGESSGPKYHEALTAGSYATKGIGGAKSNLSDRPKTGPRRAYHFDDWTPPPTTPAVILDPFGGTGTTALTAKVLGRNAISVDMSADYCRLATWRTTDPGEIARAMEVPKPPKQVDGQADLFAFMND